MIKVYELEPSVGFGQRLSYSESMELRTQLCPAYPEHSFSERWSRPLKVVGPVLPLTDFEWTVYGDIVIGDEVARDLRRVGFSGIVFGEVEIFTTTETPIGRNAWELRITGRAGIAPASSGVHVLKECPVCKRRVFSGFTHPGELFSPEQWDGSDFFTIWPLPRYVMITDRVRS